MHLIATQVDDSREQLRGKLAAQGERPGYAIDPYFYRSHLVHELELEHLIFKSWIYALHSSEIPEVGDYQILELVKTRSLWFVCPTGRSKPCTTSVDTGVPGSARGPRGIEKPSSAPITAGFTNWMVP